MHLGKWKKYNTLNEPNSTQNILEVSKLIVQNILIIYRDPRDAFASFITKDWSPHNVNDAANFKIGI